MWPMRILMDYQPKIVFIFLLKKNNNPFLREFYLKYVFFILIRIFFLPIFSFFWEWGILETTAAICHGIQSPPMLVKADPIYNITEGPAGTSRFRVFFFGLEPIGWVQRIWILILDRFSVLAGKWWRYPKNFELLCGLKRLKPTKNKDSHNDLRLRMLLSGALGGEDWMMPTCIKMEW